MVISIDPQAIIGPVPNLRGVCLGDPPEPLNEDCAMWDRLHRRATAAVRRTDPFCTITLDSVDCASPRCFSGLELSGDPNTVYNFHDHQPGLCQCQKRRELKDRSTYCSGFIPRKPPEDPQDSDLVRAETTEGRFWNRARLLEEWREVSAFRERNNVAVSCAGPARPLEREPADYGER